MAIEGLKGSSFGRGFQGWSIKWVNPLPLNLRHVDLQAVLAEISTKAGLRVCVPDQPYAKVKAPFLQPGQSNLMGPRRPVMQRRS